MSRVGVNFYSALLF